MDFSAKKNHQIFHGLKLVIATQKLQKTFMSVARTFHHTIPATFDLNYLKSLKATSRNSPPLVQLLLWETFNSRVGKHPDSACQEGNKIITNDFSESSLCATQRKSFDNDLNNRMENDSWKFVEARI